MVQILKPNHVVPTAPPQTHVLPIHRLRYCLSSMHVINIIFFLFAQCYVDMYVK